MTSPTRHRVHGRPRTDHSLDIKLFAPELMKTEQGLQNALTALDKSWWDNERKPLEFTVKELMAGPANLFEYTVAIAREWSATPSVLYRFMQMDTV